MKKSEIENNPTMLPVSDNALYFALWRIILRQYCMEQICEKLWISIEELMRTAKFRQIEIDREVKGRYNQYTLTDNLIHFIDNESQYANFKLYYETDYYSWKVNMIKITPIQWFNY